jgi:hypothetical protein
MGYIRAYSSFLVHCYSRPKVSTAAWTALILCVVG